MQIRDLKQVKNEVWKTGRKKGMTVIEFEDVPYSLLDVIQDEYFDWEVVVKTNGNVQVWKKLEEEPEPIKPVVKPKVKQKKKNPGASERMTEFWRRKREEQRKELEG